MELQMNISEIQVKTDEELLEMAVELGIVDNGSTPRRHELMGRVFRSLVERHGEPVRERHPGSRQ